jgi:hypothetical protein
LCGFSSRPLRHSLATFAVQSFARLGKVKPLTAKFAKKSSQKDAKTRG